MTWSVCGEMSRARAELQGADARLALARKTLERKRALLAHFGSAKAVTRAGLADLRAAPGISGAMAEAIHGFFHGDD